MTSTMDSRSGVIAFVLQGVSWQALRIRRGSSADVSVRIAVGEEGVDDDAADRSDAGACLAWQFLVEGFDVGFQIMANGQPVQELERFAALGVEADADREEGERHSGGGEADAVTERVRTSSASKGDALVQPTAEGAIEQAMMDSVYTFRWDNSYSRVRHKHVQYRFMVMSSRAWAAAEVAVHEQEERDAASAVKPHLTKRLALERRLTVDEVSFEQTRAIEQLQRCVTDMVSAFMMDPDRPLHEGSVREFVVSLEAVLRNGIKESHVTAWPEEPYFAFLLQIGTVLRDDRGLLDEVNALSLENKKLPCLGWTRSRALLFLALNKNMLHHAFENLVKRRAVVEEFYDRHALLFMYSSARQIASYLSALNGVTFLLDPSLDPSSSLSSSASVASLSLEEDWPPNLIQCAPDAAFEGEQVVVSTSGTGKGFVFRSHLEDPDTMTNIQTCSIPRYTLTGQALVEVLVGRSAQTKIPIELTQLCSMQLVLQIRVLTQDVLLSIVDGDEEALVEPINVSATDLWCDMVICLKDMPIRGEAFLVLDNSFSVVRSKDVMYRFKAISPGHYDDAWESCHSIAQAITWKLVTKQGVERCDKHMQSLHERDTLEVNFHRRQGDDGSATADDDSSLFGRGASLITKPVSYIVGGLLSSDVNNVACYQCLTPFSFFSRQAVCPACQQVVCIPCSRHYVQLHGKGPQVKVCDRCFIKEKDIERKRRDAMSENNQGGECAEYSALRTNPSMAKYFKMLSFGVPHSGVAQKMLQDEMPSELITVFAAGPSGSSSTGATTRSRSRTDSDGTRGHHRRNSITFRKVHWTSLEATRADSSIWSRITSRRRTAPIRLSPQDFQELETLFGDTAGNSLLARQTSGKKVFSALDSRRSNNISIGLSQFKSVGGAEAILKSLKTCDFDFLTAERLATIYEISPTSVECKRYTHFRGSRARLEPAERFLVEMAEIPRVTEKVSAMLFVSQFESQHRELCTRIQKITQACYQILRCERLARFFELVLAIGNMLNSGTEMENAHGVTIESLLKLTETKSLDQSSTLLQFTVKLIHDRGEGDILLFVQELSAIAEAKRFSNVICLSQARAMQSGVTQVESEIKEEMVIDATRFEQEESKRRKQYEDTIRVNQALHEKTTPEGTKTTPDVHSGNTSPSSSESTEAPRAALMAMLRKRSQNMDTSTTESSVKEVVAPHTSGVSAGRTTGVEPAINERSQSVRVKPAELQGGHDSTSPMPKAESSSSSSGIPRKSVGGAKPPLPIRPRVDLMAAIRSRNSIPASDATGTKQNVSLSSEHSSDDGQSTPQAGDFVPRVYSMGDNPFISTMREHVLTIKAAMEELEMEVETMVAEWEGTARYLGESAVSSSSEYVLNLLNRFVLDVKMAKTLLARKGVVFATTDALLPQAQVGSIVATVYGPGVVTALRAADRKVEIKFPWNRDAYLSPSCVLASGALVRCRRFGVGILRQTRYKQGFCDVRFAFGYGVLRVEELRHETSSASVAYRRAILKSGFCVGDPVVTPFGCGFVRSLRGLHRGADNQVIIDKAAVIAVDITAPGYEQGVAFAERDDAYWSSSSSNSLGVAYLGHDRVRINY